MTAEQPSPPIPPPFDVAGLMNEGAWGWVQTRVLVLVGSIMFFDGMDTQAFALAVPAISTGLHIGLPALGWILAISFVVMALGTLVGGLASDRFGRRPVLIASIALFGLATFTASQAFDILSLGAMRLLAAFGIGAAFPGATALVAEFTPRRNRALALSLIMGCVPAGAFVAGMLASYLLPAHGWRSLFETFGLISTLGGIALASLLPESVRFMIARSAPRAKLAAALARLGHDVPERAEIVDTDIRQKAAPLRRLATGRQGADLALLSVAFLLIGLANMAIANWLPSLIARLTQDLSLGSQGVAFYSLGGLAGCFVSSLALARLGSRAAFLLFCAIAFLGAGLVAALPLDAGLTAVRMRLVFFSLGIFIPGLQVMLYAFAGQIFPTETRGTGVGFASSLGRIGAFCSGLIGPVLLGFGQLGFFGVMAVVVVAAGIVIQLVPTQISPSTGRRT